MNDMYCNEGSFPNASFHMSYNHCYIFTLCPQLYAMVPNLTSSVHSLMHFTCVIGPFKFQVCWHPFQPLSSNKITVVSATKPAHACAYVLKYAHIPPPHTHTHTYTHACTLTGTYFPMFRHLVNLCIDTGQYLWKHFTS
jgi:hypothetical protein